MIWKLNKIPGTAEFEDEVERILESNAEYILWFILKKGDIPFKIGLSDVLMCLKFAEKQGEVPELSRCGYRYPLLSEAGFFPP